MADVAAHHPLLDFDVLQLIFSHLVSFKDVLAAAHVRRSFI
jgi:hypothetical protein